MPKGTRKLGSRNKDNPLPDVGTIFCGSLEFLGVDRVESYPVLAPNRKFRTVCYWRMKCSCGDEFTRPEGSIKTAHRLLESGKRKNHSTCGNYINHCGWNVGDKVGRLTIQKIYVSDKNKDGSYGDVPRLFANCKCDCGNNYDCLTKKLMEGKRHDTRMSCGCWKSEYLQDVKSTHGFTRGVTKGNKPDKRFNLYHAAKRRAKIEDVPFNLDFEDIVIPEKCPILGIPLDLDNEGSMVFNSPSLDKFYPPSGYVKGNIQVVSFRANTMKSDGSPEEWEKIAEWCRKEEIRRKLKGHIENDPED